MIFVADLMACKLDLFVSAVACRPVTPRLWSGFLVQVAVVPSILGILSVTGHVFHVPMCPKHTDDDPPLSNLLRSVSPGRCLIVY
jgi:hypothetical protein